MNITIEIGSDEQKEYIKKELEIIKNILDQSGLTTKLVGIWVPLNFDRTVNKLQGTSDYRSNRGHWAVAKNMVTESGVALVFSPYLYTPHSGRFSAKTLYLEGFRTLFIHRSRRIKSFAWSNL